MCELIRFDRRTLPGQYANISGWMSERQAPIFRVDVRTYAMRSSTLDISVVLRTFSGSMRDWLAGFSGSMCEWRIGWVVRVGNKLLCIGARSEAIWRMLSFVPDSVMVNLLALRNSFFHPVVKDFMPHWQNSDMQVGLQEGIQEKMIVVVIAVLNWFLSE